MRNLEGAIWSSAFVKEGLPYCNTASHGSKRIKMQIFPFIRDWNFSSPHLLLQGEEVQGLVGWLVIELENRVEKAWDLEQTEGEKGPIPCYSSSYLWTSIESLGSNPYTILNLIIPVLWVSASSLHSSSFWCWVKPPRQWTCWPRAGHLVTLTKQR